MKVRAIPGMHRGSLALSGQAAKSGRVQVGRGRLSWHLKAFDSTDLLALFKYASSKSAIANRLSAPTAESPVAPVDRNS